MWKAWGRTPKNGGSQLLSLLSSELACGWGREYMVSVSSWQDCARPLRAHLRLVGPAMFDIGLEAGLLL